MTIEQALSQDIQESKRWLNLEKDESTYKRDLAKRIELINWVRENMKNPDVQICEADPLHSELRILDWILYRVCSNEIYDPDLIADIPGGMTVISYHEEKVNAIKPSWKYRVRARFYF